MVSMVSVSTEHGLFIGISNNTIFHYDYDLDHIKAMIAPLGIPWHTIESSPFGESRLLLLCWFQMESCFEKLFISTKPN